MKMTKEEAFKMLQGKKVYAGEFTKQVQEKLFEIGFEWSCSRNKALEHKFIIISNCDYIYAATNINDFLKENNEEITISQILGIELEPEFKDGDILYCKKYIFNFCDIDYYIIYKSKYDNNIANYYAFYNSSDNVFSIDNNCLVEGFKIATEEQKQILFDKLDKQGYKWNAEEKKLEKKRWRANKGEKYYCIDESVCVYGYIKYNDNNDDMYYNAHNYFQTEQEAQQYADKIKKLLLNIQA